MFDGNSVIRRELTEDGDFRSDECIEILKQSDVVVTNPPFSLFREFVDCLVGNGLDFLIVGNINAITYKNFFPLLKDDRVWMGYTSLKKFDTPNGESTAIARWFTNLEIKKRSNPIPLTACYYGNEEKYPHYDNYDAINVDRVKDIPGDYFECIGVPITFMEKCCPDQFEIVGCTESEGVGFSNGLFKEGGGSEATSGTRTESVQEDLHSPKIKVTQSANGSLRIFPQRGVNLQLLALRYEDEGFTYCSGVMGVPITFMEKYCPEQFEIVAFRKGDDGRDLVFSRGGNKSSTVFSSSCSTAVMGLITGSKQTICCDGKSRYARMAIRRKR